MYFFRDYLTHLHEVCMELTFI